MTRFVLCTFLFSCLAFSCASANAPTGEEDEAFDEGALSTEAASLAGKYTSVEATYATELTLAADGTFEGKI
jgi:hypothetical protein